MANEEMTIFSEFSDEEMEILLRKTYFEKQSKSFPIEMILWECRRRCLAIADEVEDAMMSNAHKIIDGA